MSDTELEFETKNCWEVYADPRDRRVMEDTAREYLDFLSACKTERQVVDFVQQQAQAKGYTEDFSGDKVMRVFRGKTVFLARKGVKPLSQGYRLIGAHGDSPRLDLKQRPLYEDCGVGQAKTHYYGGIRKHQWLSRPLALHGVVVRADGQTVNIRLGEDPEDPVFTVPDLLPHLAQKQAEQKLSKAFDAEKMNIILGHRPAESNGDEDKKKNPIKARVLALLNEKYGLVEEDLYSAELQAVPAGPARFVGLDGSLMGGYGHDDRICVYAALKALLDEQDETPEHAQVVIFWDKEEIGSDGSTGAKSLFFEYCVDELLKTWGEAEAHAGAAHMRSKAISGDVHGALDPDYQDLHEKLNSAIIGHGPCFCKFTGHRGKYGANDAHAEYVGWLRRVMNSAGVPWQMAELGKVDIGGGGTVAKHLAAYGMDIIDMGPPVLAMHSPFEVASVADLHATVLAYRAFLKS